MGPKGHTWMFTRFLTGPLCFVPRLFRGQFANVRWVGGEGWMSGPLKSDNLTQCNELSDIFPVFPTLELYRKMYIYMVRPQKYIFTFPCEGSLSFSHCHASVVGSVGHIKLGNCWATLLTQLCRTMQIALLEIHESHFYYRSFVGESGWNRQLVSYLLPLGGNVGFLSQSISSSILGLSCRQSPLSGFPENQ